MEDIIHKFGIDGRLIVIQIINFSVLLGLLSYFLYKPLLKMLSDREDTIRKGIADAEDAAKAKSEATSLKQDVVAAAHSEAEAINSRAKAHADEVIAAATTEAAAKAASVMESAQKRASEIASQALKDSEAEIAKSAILAAEKILKNT